MGDIICEFYVGGAKLTTITVPEVSWSVATLLIGEGQGFNGSQPASTWWFDRTSIIQDGTQLLGNRGFESALAGSYLTPNVYGNWCNIHPSRGSNRYSDVVLDDDWSGGIKKGLGYGCWLHQDLSLTTLHHVEAKAMMRRSSTTPNGACGMQVMLNWDRGGGSIVGSAGIYYTNSGAVNCVLNATTQTGFTVPSPDDVWTEWKIRLYPPGTEPTSGGWHLGLVS